MLRLRKRAEFLAARRGRRLNYRAFAIEVAPSSRSASGEPVPAKEPRFGFTATKKMGNAVMRNRMRRRLKEAVRLVLAETSPPAADFVIIARAESLSEPFYRLRHDLAAGLSHSQSSEQGGTRNQRPERRRTD
ncbi:MAG: ribonuclease P protein component [Bauldia sp.]